MSASEAGEAERCLAALLARALFEHRTVTAVPLPTGSTLGRTAEAVTGKTRESLSQVEAERLLHDLELRPKGGREKTAGAHGEQSRHSSR